MNKKDFILEMYNKGQIDFKESQWKDNNWYHFRFNGGRGIEEDKALLKICAEETYKVIRNIAPDATHICGIPDAGKPVAKEISSRYGLQLLDYNKGWHSIHDFARYLKSEYSLDCFRCVESLDPTDAFFSKVVNYVDSGLDEFVPHGSWGKLKGEIKRGSKIVIFDNVASKTCESKFESMNILKNLLFRQGIRIGRKIGVDEGVDAEIAGIVVLQNNSPLAYKVLDRVNFGAVLEAPETFGYLRQMNILTNENYPGILLDLDFLEWFTDYGKEAYRGNKELYSIVCEDFEKWRIGLRDRCESGNPQNE